MRLVQMIVLLGWWGDAGRGCGPGMRAQQASPVQAPVRGKGVALREGWQVGSSCAQPLNGEAVSAAGFDTRGWYAAKVPSTVLAVQLANDAFRKDLPADRGDLFFGLNLRKLPGMSYPEGTFFANMTCRRTVHTSAVGGIGGRSQQRKARWSGRGCTSGASTTAAMCG